VHARLVQTNWIRTVLWTARLAVVAAIAALPGESAEKNG
jgi:hypothetical protein